MEKTSFEFLKHLRLFPGVISVLFAWNACSHNPYDSVDTYINQYINENNIPGLACCIVKDDQMQWSNAYGKANIGEDKTMSVEGIMNKGVFKGTRILKESTIEKMLTLQLDENKSQGLCWHRTAFESLWGHSGGDPGVGTNMYFHPETKIGVITFQNNNNGNSFDAFKKLYLAAKAR